MPPRLIHIATTVSFVLCFAVSALWLRSYWVGHSWSHGTRDWQTMFWVRSGEAGYFRVSGMHKGYGLIDTQGQWQHRLFGRSVPNPIHKYWHFSNPYCDHFLSISIPLPAVASPLAVLPAVSFRRWLRSRIRQQRRAQGLCETCGYSMLGNVSGICPECGAVFADADDRARIR